MKVDDRREVTLTIDRSGDDWWNVHVSDMAGSEFAMASARTLDLALRGAVPYIACATDDVSDQMAHLLAAAKDHDLLRDEETALLSRAASLLESIKAVCDEPLDERRGHGPTRSKQFARIDELMRDYPKLPDA